MSMPMPAPARPCHVCGKDAAALHTAVTRAVHMTHYAAHGGAGMCAAPVDVRAYRERASKVAALAFAREHAAEGR